MKDISFRLIAVITLFILLDGTFCERSRPTSIDSGAWCDTCQAIVREVIKKLGNKRKEYEVLEAYDGICTYENFYTYNSPPPQMEKNCKEFISAHEDEIIDGITHRKSNDSAESDICAERTKACIEDGNETTGDL